MACAATAASTTTATTSRRGTKNRVPAIEAWDEQRLEQFGTPKLDIGLETWPEHFPNVAQTKFLVRNGIREPVISELTRIGTVEGFGSMLRYSPMPDMQRSFDEEITGTAIAHLGHGLYEAHARDEAGFEEEAGHNLMWFAARDIAFENPVTEDQTQLMLERMGIPMGDPKQMAKLREAAMANRLLPDGISFELESLVGRMIRLLFIEISAFHAFAWAEEVLGDHDLVAGEGEAADLVSYIRADETPHVAYLGTVLSEMRDRTWVGDDGSRHDGREMIGRLWERSLADSTGPNRQQFLDMVMREIGHAVEGRSDRDDLLEEFLSLGTAHRAEDGTWIDETDRRGTGGAGRGATA
ncbi:MAG: hypothetical protein U5R31_02355 [Acidimicrobiia bacterium]|nr:hypothetical protein [Acidimicrobiia bacterium]